MKKYLVITIFCIIFAAFLVLSACSSMKLSTKYCNPAVGCVGLELDLKKDSTLTR